VGCTLGETVLAGRGARRAALMVARGGALGSRAKGFPPFIGGRHLQGGSRGKTTTWARGTAASGVAGGKGRRGLPMASGGQREAVWLGPWACGAWRRGIGRVDIGARAGEPTVAGMPRHPGPGGPTAGARAVWRADVARQSSGASGQNQFHLSFFDRVFLKKLEL
jgi:hypothetical protein